MAGICREQVDTGAVIVTGETSRKENAAQVLESLSHLAGDFVVATAGPDLESILAAKGAGAVDWSADTGSTVLHMDIGGGTANLAYIQDGKILYTGCLNVGGRLLKLDKQGNVSYVSPVLEGLTQLRPGDTPTREQVAEVAQLLAKALEMAAGLRPPTELLHRLQTKEATQPWTPPKAGAVLSFSGGVADCIDNQMAPGQFGDIGPLLGSAIRESLLCQGSYRLGKETIRATVIGAGSYSTQLSGSTVFYRNVTLPMQNLPVAVFTWQEQASEELPRLIDSRIRQKDTQTVVLALPGVPSPTYGQVAALADAIVQGIGDRQVYVCLEADMAKALGHALCLRLGSSVGCLCIDSVSLTQDSFLDIGAPVGPCLPVVVKTLALEKQN